MATPDASTPALTQKEKKERWEDVSRWGIDDRVDESVSRRVYLVLDISNGASPFEFPEEDPPDPRARLRFLDAIQGQFLYRMDEAGNLLEPVGFGEVRDQYIYVRKSHWLEELKQQGMVPLRNLRKVEKADRGVTAAGKKPRPVKELTSKKKTVLKEPVPEKYIAPDDTQGQNNRPGQSYTKDGDDHTSSLTEYCFSRTRDRTKEDGLQYEVCAIMLDRGDVDASSRDILVRSVEGDGGLVRIRDLEIIKNAWNLERNRVIILNSQDVVFSVTERNTSTGTDSLRQICKGIGLLETGTNRQLQQRLQDYQEDQSGMSDTLLMYRVAEESSVFSNELVVANDNANNPDEFNQLVVNKIDGTHNQIAPGLLRLQINPFGVRILRPSSGEAKPVMTKTSHDRAAINKQLDEWFSQTLRSNSML